MKNKKAVVLLSAGLDSTVNLFLAKEEFEVVKVLTFNYGQRAAKKEIEKSSLICKKLNLPHQIIDLSWFVLVGKSSLLDKNKNVPVGAQVDITDLNASYQTAKSVWVPNRNGIFLNIAAGFAESLEADYVIPGFNKEEAATFPDNSVGFMKVLDQSFSYSTQNKVQVFCFTHSLVKTEILKKLLQLNVDLKSLWPCYFDNEAWCGECESCKRFINALNANNIKL